MANRKTLSHWRRKMPIKLIEWRTITNGINILFLPTWISIFICQNIQPQLNIVSFFAEGELVSSVVARTTSQSKPKAFFDELIYCLSTCCALWPLRFGVLDFLACNLAVLTLLLCYSWCEVVVFWLHATFFWLVLLLFVAWQTVLKFIAWLRGVYILTGSLNDTLYWVVLQNSARKQECCMGFHWK